MERWGALSVTDHKDARALAAEVLLYDRLVVPEPYIGQVAEWERSHWDPDGLSRRLEQLGDDLAYRAVWSANLREDWRKNWPRFKELVEDAKHLSQAQSQEAALHLTRKILSMRHPVMVPKGGVQPEVVAVYRSQRDAQLPVPDGMQPANAADYVVGIIRLLAPNDRDAEDALRRAIDIARDQIFRERREAVHRWQRSKIEEWSRAGPDAVSSRKVGEAIRELESLIQRYNEVVRKGTRKRRVEAAILTGSIAASAVALAANVAPDAFAWMSVGALAGAKVTGLGGFGASAFLQVKKHLIGATEPDAATRVPAVGAMFHQLEGRVGWQARRLGEV